VSIKTSIFGAILLLLFTVACGASPATSSTSPGTSITSPATAIATAQVAAILSASDQHYLSMFTTGTTALGTTQYPDGSAGVAAFNDPQSAASRFRDWRQSSKAEQDLSFMDAFKQADAFYTADNEPPAMASWRDDMNQAQADLIGWVQVAVKWQISQASSADLGAAAKTFTNDMTTAQKDATAVTGG